MSQEEKLKHYHALLLKWQAKINLISPSTINDAWNRHFEDSTQIEPLIPKEAKVLFDLGCGAGFPGLPIAMMRDDLDIHLIESDQKKCSFMKAVSRETKTHVTVHNERIEKCSIDTVPDVITARALASLDKLFTYCRPWTEQNPSLTLIFLKGEKAESEINTAQKNWQFEVTSHNSKTAANAAILVLNNIKKR